MRFLSDAVKQRGVHVQLWLEDEHGEGFGKGRIQLLQLIDELGSLSKAAKELEMSYRGAWGKLKKMEQIAGVPLVESCGTKRDGYSLTPAGRELVASFSEWYQDVERFATERAAFLFGKLSTEITEVHHKNE